MMVRDLKELIEAYLEQKSSRTMLSLAVRSGVNYSCIRRILQGEVKKVSLHNTFSILRVVTDWAGMLTYLKKHFPETAEILALQYPITDLRLARETPGAKIDDFESFVIISLAKNPHGVTESRIFKTLGTRAQAQINQLVQSKLIVERDGRYHADQECSVEVDLKFGHQRLAHCAHLLRQDLCGSQKQIISHLTAGVSPEGQRLLHTLLTHTQEKIEQICERNPGDQVIFTNLVMGEF
jgi:hypothetical protein